jgi:hypothetical protein
MVASKKTPASGKSSAAKKATGAKKNAPAKKASRTSGATNLAEVTFQNIVGLFRQVDIQHMAGFGVKLNDSGWMTDAAGGKLGICNQSFPDHTHARTVYAWLAGVCTPRMPMGGPYWGQAALSLYAQWMTDGFQP